MRTPTLTLSNNIKTLRCTRSQSRLHLSFTRSLLNTQLLYPLSFSYTDQKRRLSYCVQFNSVAQRQNPMILADQISNKFLFMSIRGIYRFKNIHKRYHPDDSLFYHSKLLTTISLKHHLLCSNYLKIGNRCIHTAVPRYNGTPDPYKVLGLSRDASLSDVKRKYREMAKQHHPDLNPGPDSAATMASISSAYQLLSDPKKREFYDQSGMAPEDAGFGQNSAGGSPFGTGFGTTDSSFVFTDFTSFFTDAFGGNSRPGGHVHKGEDIATEISLDFIEAALGCRKVVHLQTKSTCDDCTGSGCAPGTNLGTCRTCNGTGTQKIERGPIIFGTVCSRCAGSGQVVTHPCKACKGSGVRLQPRAVDLDFPAGVRNSMELRINAQGHSGVRGGRAGDLFVKVHVKPHHQFRLIQDDLHITVPLTLKQCLLGGEATIPTLDGNLKLVVPPGTAPGEIKTLRSKGIKRLQERGYGDLCIHWSLIMPKTLTDRQKELIIELDNIEHNRFTETKEAFKQSTDTVKRQYNSTSSDMPSLPPKPERIVVVPSQSSDTFSDDGSLNHSSTNSPIHHFQNNTVSGKNFNNNELFQSELSSNHLKQQSHPSINSTISEDAQTSMKSCNPNKSSTPNNHSTHFRTTRHSKQHKTTHSNKSDTKVTNSLSFSPKEWLKKMTKL